MITLSVKHNVMLLITILLNSPPHPHQVVGDITLPPGRRPAGDYKPGPAAALARARVRWAGV